MTKVKHLIQALANYGMEKRVVILDQRGRKCDVTVTYGTAMPMLILSPTPKVKRSKA